MAAPATTENSNITAIKRGSVPPARFHEAVNDRNIWNVSPFAGTVLSDVLKPEYWASVAGRCRPFDRIEVTPEDNTWWAELMVRDVGTKTVTVQLMRKVEFKQTEIPSAQSLPYEVDFTPGSKWRVIRKADRAVISEGHLTKEAAFGAATESLKATA